MVADAKVTEFKTLIQDTSISDANVENIFDLAANTYNIFGCDVTNMAGTAGSKTVTYTSAEKGAVYQGARIIYASFYKNPANHPNANAGATSVTSTDLQSNSVIWTMLKEIAEALKGASSTYPRIAFHIGQATS